MPVPSLPAALAIYLLFANLLTWFAFRLDKRRAASGGWRFPEANLLALSAAGAGSGRRSRSASSGTRRASSPLRAVSMS